jgi:FG-GAP-like repeat
LHDAVDTRPRDRRGNGAGRSAHALTYGPATHYPVGYQPNSVAVGDFNKDGNPDLAVANESVPGRVSILLGDGTGAFSGPTNYTVENDAFWVAVGDFNEDTNPDLAVASVRGSEGISILLGNGDGTFTTGSHSATGETYSLAVGDFNGDHHLDIVSSEHGDLTPGINYIAGHGDGTFSAPVHYNGESLYVAAGDVNGDGNLDIVDTNYDSSNNTQNTGVLLGDGAGNFGPRINTVSATGPPALGDLNKDGKLDAAVTDGQQNLYVLLGDGTGSFTVTTGFQAPGLHTFLTIADFNQDGNPDVGVLDSYFTTVGVAFGNGTGALTHPTTWPTHDPPAGTSFGMAVADFNHDGKLDFAASGRDGPNDVSILLNRTGTFYPRPKGATPMVVSLVPAYNACASPNNTHGAPLAYGSCSSPSWTSQTLTVGTPDANGAAANSVASVRFDVKASPSDVAIKTSISDVRCTFASLTTCGATNQAAGPDYIGEVQVATTRRITDRLSYVDGVDQDQGTTQDAPFAVTVPCVSTSDKKIGSTCASTTTANAVLPGSVQAGARAVWQLDKVQVFDGGADGDADTPGDNTLYMDQGVFVP